MMFFVASSCFARRVSVSFAACVCTVLGGCTQRTTIIPGAATGALEKIPSEVLRNLTDAKTIMEDSIDTLVEDGKHRIENITQGAEKIREGKQQVEKGVRGE